MALKANYRDILECYVVVVVVVVAAVVDVLILTRRHKTIHYVVAGQAPITLEEEYLGRNKKQANNTTEPHLHPRQR